MHVACAWVFTVLRIAHSLVQADGDIILIRFSCFAAEWNSVAIRSSARRSRGSSERAVRRGGGRRDTNCSMPDAPIGDAAREVLESVLRHADFRPGQVEAVAAALAGRDAIRAAAPGSGKSLCDQGRRWSRAAAGQGTAIVISPLIALMRIRWCADGAGWAGSRRSTASRMRVAARRRRPLYARRARAAYVSPERAALASFRGMLARTARVASPSTRRTA